MNSPPSHWLFYALGLGCLALSMFAEVKPGEETHAGIVMLLSFCTGAIIHNVRARQ